MNDNDYKKIANLCYEIGTLRQINRSHRQHFFVTDASDNIGSHSHRVSCIALMLAKMEGVDPYKTLTMALFHDVPEARTGDQNWVHKKYVSVDEKQIIEDQFSELPFSDIYDFLNEYDKRESPESLVAKDADLLDQILLLREYEYAGNNEAKRWLYGEDEHDPARKLEKLKTESAKKIGQEILNTRPSQWWNTSWTDKSK